MAEDSGTRAAREPAAEECCGVVQQRSVVILDRGGSDVVGIAGSRVVPEGVDQLRDDSGDHLRGGSLVDTELPGERFHRLGREGVVKDVEHIGHLPNVAGTHGPLHRRRAGVRSSWRQRQEASDARGRASVLVTLG